MKKLFPKKLRNFRTLFKTKTGKIRKFKNKEMTKIRIGGLKTSKHVRIANYTDSFIFL